MKKPQDTAKVATEAADKATTIAPEGIKAAQEVATVETAKPGAVVETPKGGGVTVLEGMDAMEAMAGSGMEKVTAKDILIPRIGLVQALSDQVKKKHTSYIEGAEIGDIVDTGTNELLTSQNDPDAPKAIHVIPVVYDKVYLEWAPRASGKGLIAIHPTAEILERCKPNSKNQPCLDNGNYVAETAQLYLLNLSMRRRPSFLPFTSTQLKKARRWMTLAQGERLKNSAGREYMPPLFYRTYLLSSAMESNNEGEWAGWVIKPSVAMPELDPAIFGDWRDIMADAVKFRDTIFAGMVQGDLTNMTDDPSTIDGTATRTEGGGDDKGGSGAADPYERRM